MALKRLPSPIDFITSKKQKYEARVLLKRNDKYTYAFGHKQKNLSKMIVNKFKISEPTFS